MGRGDAAEIMKFLGSPPLSSHSPIQSSPPSKPISIPLTALPLPTSPLPLPSSPSGGRTAIYEKILLAPTTEDRLLPEPNSARDIPAHLLTRLIISSPLNRTTGLSSPPIFKTLSTKSPSPKNPGIRMLLFYTCQALARLYSPQNPSPPQLRLPPLPSSFCHKFPITQTAFSQLFPKISQNFLRPLPEDPISTHHYAMPAPGIPLQLPIGLNPSAAQRIKMNIPHQLQKIGFFFTDHGFIPVLKQMARPMMPSVKMPRIAGHQAAHE